MSVGRHIGEGLTEEEVMELDGEGGRVSCWEEGAGCRLMESRLPISPSLPPVAAAEAEYTEQQRG